MDANKNTGQNQNKAAKRGLKAWDFALVLILVALIVVYATGLTVETGVAISETNFPDPAFRAIVKGPGIDLNQDGVLSAGEIAAVTEQLLDNCGIADLQGIEHFTALTSLDCSSNRLITLDVSKNSNLVNLFCGDNQLSLLKLSDGTYLKHIDCGNNTLSALDISNCPDLEYLSCKNNWLTALNIAGNAELTSLYCEGNKLSALDFRNSTRLEYLHCGDNVLARLNVSSCPALEFFYCGGNQLTFLDVSKNTELTHLYCDRNLLTILDVSKNAKLDTLDCSGNPLEHLPFTDIIKTWYRDHVLFAYNNNLISDTQGLMFRPDEKATRAVLVTALYRNSGSPSIEDVKNPFDDVSADEFYADAVIWAEANNIVNGTGDKIFEPNKFISRQELAVVLMRYENFAGLTLPIIEEQQFADEDSISGYARTAVKTLSAQGIVTGKDDKSGNIFDPTGSTTRAEVAAVLHRLLDLINAY